VRTWWVITLGNTGAMLLNTGLFLAFGNPINAISAVVSLGAAIFMVTVTLPGVRRLERNRAIHQPHSWD